MDENPFDHTESLKLMREDIQEKMFGDSETTSQSVKETGSEAEIGTKFNIISDCESQEPAQKKSNPNVYPQPEDEDMEWMASRFNRLLLTTFHDGIITLHDGQELRSEPEHQMRNSLLATTFLSLGNAYMQMGHWELANQALSDAHRITGDVSLLLYKLAIAKLCNLDSGLAEVLDGQRLIECAWKLKDTEELFKASAAALKAAGIDNYLQAYQEVRDYANKRVAGRSQFERENFETVLSKCAAVDAVEKKLLAEGKTPLEGSRSGGLGSLLGYQDIEAEIFQKMHEKFIKCLEFFIDTKDRDSFAKGTQDFLRQKSLMEQYYF
jgi:tetratricopeptide (TPR) repeat protein